ncbi:unnamed protein product [Leptosia nina]|uniref:Phosphatidic acid phosphatase type 2/haloperoxidase domain-containing protein n=1 Tax=Leptosia nina TaxID=320188 RepID=A0AAV1JY78_9NEOP
MESHCERNSNCYMLRKILLDLIFLLIVGFLVLVFFLWGVPYERGFFWDDRSLKLPFKDSTVTSAMLYSIGFTLPLVTMLITEYLRLRNYQGQSRAIFDVEIPAWIWETYRVVGIFLFGCACQQLATGIGKYSIGGLRPHFFDVCNPDVNCTLPENIGRYIDSYTCLGDNSRRLRQMRLSFPSGHASFSSYTMVFLALYLQKRVSWHGSKVLRHFLQFVVIMMAWYTGMSRVSDNKHHWGDVIAGFIIGAGAAVLAIVFLYKPTKVELCYSCLTESTNRQDTMLRNLHLARDQY